MFNIIKLWFLFSGFILITRANRGNVNTSSAELLGAAGLNETIEFDFEKRGKQPLSGWSIWSDWSTCSRSCDGGVSHQLRRCYSPNGCNGESVRYKICNMQQCPDNQDFRAHQCAANNDVPYDGALFKWIPHYDYVDPCALTCRGRPEHLSDENPHLYDEFEDEPNVVVQLAARVQDGTRCRPGSLDMCIQGKCQRVGCDLKIGSSKKVDLCGVCGGDGSSCTQPIYHWETSPMSLCSVTCGGGYKMARPYCRNRVTGIDVDESLCSAATRPHTTVIECNTHQCPPKWITEKWGPCSKMCGRGKRERVIYCAEESGGMKIKVHDNVCKTIKPPTQEICNEYECPKWVVSDWSGCSVSCGVGIQIRSVECENIKGQLNTQCDPITKPEVTQTCSTGIKCSIQPIEEFNFDDDLQNESNEEDDVMIADQPNMGDDEEEEDDDFYQTEEVKNNVYIPNKASFVKDKEWSPCTVTCGEGIKRKQYRCKIFLEFSKALVSLNDSMCAGIKPHDQEERCIQEPCFLAYSFEDSYHKENYRQPNDNFKVQAAVPGKTYSWREQGYTSCSASCLGGVEDLIINCVRDDTEKVVSPFLCSPETKPEARIRTCNDRPCPPRWNVSDYSPCSKSCGIGIKTREVLCIHEVTRGGENTMIVPHSMCPQPAPADRQYCNVLDCPVRWEVSEWTKCSKSCGGGVKERKVGCKQIMAQEHKVERPASLCPPNKPSDKKPCNTKPCESENQRPVISINNTTYIQHETSKPKVTLKIGGAATVFVGTKIKIMCPVKKFNRTKIRWSKDYKPLNKTKRCKVSKKGALRIISAQVRDAGIYTCHAGLSTADLHLTIVPRPSHTNGSPQSSSANKNFEDFERHMDNTDLDSNSDNTKIQDINQSSFFIFTNNQSYEQTTLRSRPDQRKTKGKLKSRERGVKQQQNKLETKEPSHFHSHMTMSEIEPTLTSCQIMYKPYKLLLILVIILGASNLNIVKIAELLKF